MERQFDWCLTAARHELARHGTAHHLWQFWLTMLSAGPWIKPGAADAIQKIIQAHAAGLDVDEYRNLMHDKEIAGELIQVDRALLDASRALSQSAAAWQSGYLRLGMPESAVSELENLILPQDEFIKLRDAYQNVYESICQALWLTLYGVNLSRNGKPEDFTGLYYTDSNGAVKRINSIAALKRLSNAFKIAALRESTPYAEIFAPLDNRLRNAIGHASARHNLREGVITSDKGERMHYFDFVARVYSLTLPLSAVVSVVRGARVLAAEVQAQRSA